MSSPQVAGAVRDTVEYAATVAGFELASAVDTERAEAVATRRARGHVAKLPVAA